MSDAREGDMTAVEAPNLQPEFRKLLLRLEQLLRGRA